ncbi:hypothetical protein MKX03_027986 [Papaver bracteatum]|nr:hypothetical protein MKX03_027986 [Papaver bracteatum]
MDAPNIMTVTIKEYQGDVPNQVFEAAETFLNTKVSTKMKGVELSKSEGDKKDDFEGIHLVWRLVGCSRSTPYAVGTDESPTRFELSFDQNHYRKVVESYIPYLIKKAKELNDANTTWKLYGSSDPYSGHAGGVGGGVNLQHPSTFQSLAMDPELKKDIIDDLDRFVKGRDYFTKVGKAWNRSYLLYGPPGTGKSSLVAAMADYLNFDIYDMELTNNVHSYSLPQSSQWRSVLMGIKRRSIILIQDIDCSDETHARSKIREPVHPYGRPYPEDRNDAELTLSGLLNVMDGMWSSCGDEKIIVFTTNDKDKLDPALLRPGRIDKHIHMSYLTPQGFRILASNYLSIEEHRLFGEIDELIQESQTTPAEVAKQLMVSNDADISLNGLTHFLKTKILVAKQVKEEEAQKALDEEKYHKETKDRSGKMRSKFGPAPTPHHPSW